MIDFAANAHMLVATSNIRDIEKAKQILGVQVMRDGGSRFIIHPSSFIIRTFTTGQIILKEGREIG